MRKASFNEHIDYSNVIATIQSYNPKVLNISGGEPSLVKNLHEIVAEIKKRWNPFIRIVHNGTGPENLEQCFPFIDRLVVSMDGLDPINKANRGITSESVLKKLAKVLPELQARNIETAINCVLTTANLTSMKDFARRVRDVSPRIILSFTPLMPPDMDLSILKEPATYHKFLSDYAALKSSGYSVVHMFEGLTRHADFRNVQCYNQNFIIRISPEGRVFTCSMNTKLTGDHYKYYLGKMFSKNTLKKVFDRVRKIANRKLFKTIDFSCSTVCMCENWLDLVFLGIPSDGIRSYAECLKERMSEEDYTRAEEYVRRHINPSFSKDQLRRYVNGLLEKEKP
jgi:MoaA/NifB/PqqE/SkfB family radical SAM enzyme